MKADARRDALTRLNRIEGQVRGLKRMIDEGEYCVDVITQTSAVKRALSSVEDVLLKSHLSTCVIDQIQNGKQDQAQTEILKVYALKRS